jgi:hypothetical protein
MTHTESYALCKEIYHVLKKFKDIELIEKEKLFSLIEIHSFLQEIYTKLHLNYIDNKIPLNKERQEITNTIINIHMELANAYYEVMLANKTARNKLSEQYLGLTACKGLQGLGIVFLTTAEIYIEPPQGFWLLCYRLFSLSEEYNVLDNKIKIDNAIYSAAVLFKQLIIFFIIDKNQISARENSEVFQLLLRGINYMQSYVLAMVDTGNNPVSEIFGFSLQNDTPPAIQTNMPLTTARLLRYVEKYEVIKIMQFLLRESKESPEKSLVNPNTFSRILITLEYQKNKRQRRISKQYRCSAVVGIDSLIEFLLEKEEKKELSLINNSVKEFTDDLESFQLVLDWDVEKEFSDNTIIIENLEIIDSSMNGYGITWNSNNIEKLQVGEVIGIIPDFSSTAKKN